MTLFSILISIALLIILVSVFRLHPFIAFLVAAVTSGLLLNLPANQIPAIVEAGIGNVLGPLATVICVGAMFGKLIAESGAAERIAETLVSLLGGRNIGVAMAFAGFIVGIPLFYNVGFVLLVPVIFSVTYRAKLPLVSTALPMLAGLSIAHGFLPPHPSPTTLVVQFHGDIGRTLVYGLIVGVPTLLIAGPVFAITTRRIVATPPAIFRREAASKETRKPGALASFGCALLPVALLAVTSIVQGGESAPMRGVVGLMGNPSMILLLSLFIAIGVLGIGRGASFKDIGAGQAEALRDVAGILLIIGGSGALKQVMIEGHVDATLGTLMAESSLPPLLLGWLLAMVIRIALGSATIAGLTAATLVQPVILHHGADPNLMVLAIGAGSLMCSHLNDSGFWLFKEYFGLCLVDTFRSWTLMESLIGIFGLIFTIALSAFV